MDIVTPQLPTTPQKPSPNLDGYSNKETNLKKYSQKRNTQLQKDCKADSARKIQDAGHQAQAPQKRKGVKREGSQSLKILVS